MTLAPPAAPVLTAAANVSVANGRTATLGTAAPGFGSDALSVRLVSDTGFATGITLALASGKLVYTPGPITLATTGTDTLDYAVTDTVTGAVATETQSVTLTAQAAPVVRRAAAALAINGQSVTLGVATPGSGTDALSVTMTSDTAFTPKARRLS